jgi:hypothetical protein
MAGPGRPGLGLSRRERGRGEGEGDGEGKGEKSGFLPAQISVRQQRRRTMPRPPPRPSLTYAPASQSRSRFRVLRPAVLWLAADNKIWRPIVQTCLFPNTQSSDKATESPDGKPVASESPEIEYQWPVENENTSKWWHKPEC